MPVNSEILILALDCAPLTTQQLLAALGIIHAQKIQLPENPRFYSLASLG
jgi:hypothetical protein